MVSSADGAPIILTHFDQVPNGMSEDVSAPAGHLVLCQKSDPRRREQP